MTKPQQALQHVVMVASALVTALYSYPAFAFPIIDDIKDGWDKTRKGAEFLRRGKDLSSHVESFVASIGPEDFLVGRSTEQGFVIGLMTWGLGFIFLKDWEKDKNSLILKPLAAYGLAVVAGMAFECFRTFPSTALYATGTLPIALLVFLGGLITQKQLFVNLREAMRLSQVLYFLRNRHLEVPKVVKRIKKRLKRLKKRVTRRLKQRPSKVKCPDCKKLTPSRGEICAYCGVELPKSKSKTKIKCPSCTKLTPSRGEICAYCGVELKPT